MQEELRRLGWKGEQLRIWRNGDRDKARLARRLRAETPMTWRWIAERLWMGAAGSAANVVRTLETK